MKLASDVIVDHTCKSSHRILFNYAYNMKIINIKFMPFLKEKKLCDYECEAE